MKRISLYILTNLAVMVVLGVILEITGADRFLAASGLNIPGLLVFSAIVGMAIPHFHQHLFVRHAGTPAEYDWMAGDRWPGAPRGDEPAVVELCGRLRRHIEAAH